MEIVHCYRHINSTDGIIAPLHFSQRREACGVHRLRVCLVRKEIVFMENIFFKSIFFTYFFIFDWRVENIIFVVDL